ncbi:hypothetical protein LX36DRAFT_478673 [Colletotrichum falcatum]|nr:hypothetical protein LX36DRAFT_478673 [Colletotrichum falcatum]
MQPSHPILASPAAWSAFIYLLRTWQDTGQSVRRSARHLSRFLVRSSTIPTAPWRLQQHAILWYPVFLEHAEDNEARRDKDLWSNMKIRPRLTRSRGPLLRCSWVTGRNKHSRKQKHILGLISRLSAPYSPGS